MNKNLGVSGAIPNTVFLTKNIPNLIGQIVSKLNGDSQSRTIKDNKIPNGIRSLLVKVVTLLLIYILWGVKQHC